jgi:hypothetical protein
MTARGAARALAPVLLSWTVLVLRIEGCMPAHRRGAAPPPRATLWCAAADDGGGEDAAQMPRRSPVGAVLRALRGGSSSARVRRAIAHALWEQRDGVRSPSPAVFAWSSADASVDGASKPLESARSAYAAAFENGGMPPSSDEVQSARVPVFPERARPRAHHVQHVVVCRCPPAEDSNRNHPGCLLAP